MPPAGPIAKIFWMDDALNSDLYLDGVVTVVDAKNVLKVRAPNDGSIRTTALAANGVHDRRLVIFRCSIWRRRPWRRPSCLA